MRTACMIVHSFYPDDPRVRRETEALLQAGWSVDVVCLRNTREAPVEDCGGACVYRLPVKRHRGSGTLVYLFEYLTFLLFASVRVARLHLRERYSIVHVHNMPDFLVFAGLLPRLLGARLILDIHDPMPELYMAKFGGSATHPAVRLVRLVERVSTALANHVITVSLPARRSLYLRGTPDHKLTVVMNTADPHLFRRAPEITPNNDPEHFTLVYHGTISEHYGLDTLIRAVDRLREKLPVVRLYIYGNGESSGSLRKLVDDLCLDEFVKFGGRVPISEIPSIIAAADLGVAPLRRNTFTDLAYSTKVFEYIRVGVPVITAATSGMVELLGRVPDMFYSAENVEELAARILELYSDPMRRRRLRDAAELAYAPYTWENQCRTFISTIEDLVSTPISLPRQVENG